MNKIIKNAKEKGIACALIPLSAILINAVSYFQQALGEISFYNTVLLNILNVVVCYGSVFILYTLFAGKEEQVNDKPVIKDCLRYLTVAALVVFVCYFFQNAIFNFLYAAWGYVPEKYLDLVENVMFEDMHYNFTKKMALILCYGIITPILEEVFFRKIMQSNFSRVSFPLRLVMTTACFLMSHDDYELMIFILPMSIYCSLIMAETGQLLYPILIHCIINIAGILELPINEIVFSPRYPIKYGEKNTAWFYGFFNISATALFVCVTMVLLFKEGKRTHNDRKYGDKKTGTRLDSVIYLIAGILYIILI